MARKTVNGNKIRRRTGERKEWPTAGTRMPPAEFDQLTTVAKALGFETKADYVLDVLRRDLAQRQAA